MPEVLTVGDGTLTTKELVAGLEIVAIPPGVILVVGETGTVTVLTAVPWVIVMELLVLLRAGAGTLTTKEFVLGFVTLAMPAGVMLVFGVVAIVAVVVTVPC